MFWGEPLLCLRGADEFEAVVGFCGNILGSCPLELRLGNLTWTCFQTHSFYVRIPHFVFNIFLPPQKSQSSIL